MKERHSPSEYRSIVRSVRNNEDPKKLIKLAKKIKNPAYKGPALAAIGEKISNINEINTNLTLLISELLLMIEKEWQRVEALTNVLKHTSKWIDTEMKYEMFIKVQSQLKLYDTIKSKEDAARVLGKYANYSMFSILLSTILSLDENIIPIARQSLRGFLSTDKTISELDELRNEISLINDKNIVTRLFDISQGLLRKNGYENTLFFHAAAVNAVDADNETVRILCSHSETKEEIQILEDVLIKDESNERKIIILMTLIGRAAKIGEKEKAEYLINKAENISLKLKEKEKNSVKQRIKQARSRLQGNNNEKGKKRHKKEIKMSEHSGHTLALYNTYSGQIGEKHQRVLAKAAGVAAGFGHDLLLVDWNFKNFEKFIEKTSSNSRLAGAEIIEEMYAQKRIKFCKFNDLISDYSSRYGKVVATTSKTNHDNYVSSLVQKWGSLCLIIGLGHNGLTKHILEKVSIHLEITGYNMSLETSIAIGAISAILGQHPVL